MTNAILETPNGLMQDANGIISMFNFTEHENGFRQVPVTTLLDAAEKMIDYMDLAGPLHNGTMYGRMA